MDRFDNFTSESASLQNFGNTPMPSASLHKSSLHFISLGVFQRVHYVRRWCSSGRSLKFQEGDHLIITHTENVFQLRSRVCAAPFQMVAASILRLSSYILQRRCISELLDISFVFRMAWTGWHSSPVFWFSRERHSCFACMELIRWLSLSGTFTIF